MTALDLLEYRNEPYRQELIEGVLMEMDPHGAEHGAVAARIAASLLDHVEQVDLGDVLPGWSPDVGGFFV